MKLTLALVLLVSTLAPPAPATTVDPTGEAVDHATAVERGTTYRDLFGSPSRIYGTSHLDPGASPEGDYLGWLTFTLDGGRVLASNRMTDNLTVYDWPSMEVITNIDVGRYPSGIAVTGDYAVVAASFSDEVYVVDLDDYSIAGIVPTGEQPWIVRTSPDGRYAYVSCDIENTCEKIDLESMSTVLTIPDFPVGIRMFSFFSENGRYSVDFTNFELTPDGGHVVVGDWSDDVLFYDTTTGTIDFSVSGIPDCVSVALSGDGSKVAAFSATNPMVIHQIDVATHTRTASVTIPGHQVGMTYEIGTNQDGSKAYASVSGNVSGIVRFPTEDYTLLSTTYSAFWVGTSPDHSYAVSGQYRFSIVDLAAESVVGQHFGNVQNRGAVSPVANQVASFDPMSHEGIYFYDFTPGPPAYRGTTNAGLDPEGDAPRRVAIAPDGSKAVVTNVLSDNVTILNLSTYEIEAIVPIGDRVQEVAITSDSRWAVVCGFNSNSVKILDLATDEVVADVACGTRPGVVTITPDDAHAYVGDIQSNTVSVVRLDGAASTRIAQFGVGTIGVLWAAYGVSSDVEAGPTGAYVLVAASFDDQVKVIDTATNSVVSSLPVGDFPLQIAFNGSGEYATVTNYLGNSVTVMRIDGAASSVVGTYYRGTGPLRLAYNPILDEIGVGNYTAKTVVHLDPETGSLLGTDSYAAYGNVVQVLFDENGESIVLTSSGGSPPGHLHRGGDAIALPAAPAYFDYNPATGRAVAVMPGPDYATVAVLDPAAMEEIVSLPLDRIGRLSVPEPNPVLSSTRISFTLAREGRIDLFLVDASGRTVATIGGGSFGRGTHRISWTPDGIPPGTYFTLLRVDGVKADRRKLVLVGGGR